MGIRGHFCKQYIIEFGVAYGWDELESCLLSIERYCDEHLDDHYLLSWDENLGYVEMILEYFNQIDLEDLRQYLTKEQGEILDSIIEYAKMPQNAKNGYIRIEVF
ncbi:hypothetical protein [uncultured Helicobacter sp.]|uniref:hypothetical protein n=1 Tax=uncultured Helicobacter sp. TaxID=175537 RepID=UPI00374F6375